jgi:hypothetical protein
MKLLNELIAYLPSSYSILTAIITCVLCVCFLLPIGANIALPVWLFSNVAIGVIVITLKTNWEANASRAFAERRNMREIAHIRSLQAVETLRRSPEHDSVLAIKAAETHSLSAGRKMDALEDYEYMQITRPQRVVDANKLRAVSFPNQQKTTQEYTPAQDLRNSRRPLTTRLQLSEDFNPLPNKIIGHSLLCLGQRGSGKSEFAALLAEQVGKLAIPMVIFDYLVDYDTLPQVLPSCRIAGSPDWVDAYKYRGIYWQVDLSNAEEIGYMIRESGAQVVLQVQSYPSLDHASQVITLLINGIIAWTVGRDTKKFYPMLVLMDEAQQFLPQSAQETDILKSFKKLNEIGRHYGLTLAMFTQRAARINKDVIGGTEIYVLMRQTMIQDLEVCEKQLGKEVVNRNQVRAFENGEALVSYDNESFVTRFDRRQSEHKSTQVDPSEASEHYSRRVVPETIEIHVSQAAEVQGRYPLEDEGYEDTYSNDYEEEPVRVSPQPKPKELTLKEQGVQAYLDGFTSIDKLAAKLGITQHAARQLKPVVEDMVSKIRQEEVETSV